MIFLFIQGKSYIYIHHKLLYIDYDMYIYIIYYKCIINVYIF